MLNVYLTVQSLLKLNLKFKFVFLLINLILFKSIYKNKINENVFKQRKKQINEI